MYYSLYALILSNLVPLYGVIFLGWDISTVLFLYWFENVVIGIFNTVKMSMAESPTPFLTIFLTGFFLTHYGLFTFVHGVFLATLFLKDLQLDSSILLGVFSMFLSHGVSLLLNYIGKNEYKKTNIALLMFAPYGRIVVMHLTIIFAASFVIASGATLPALVILVVLKTLTDIAAHMFEHRKKNYYYPRPWAQPMFNSFMHTFAGPLEAMYRESVRTGEFEKTTKDLDPEYVAYVKKYWDTPLQERNKIQPPK